MLRVVRVMSVACVLALPSVGFAETPGAKAAEAPSSHEHHGSQKGADQAGAANFAAADTASTEAFRAINSEMHAEMGRSYTGDADVDFMRGMIAHHAGAIAMSKVVLQHGLDPEVKSLAETIIASQEAEIATMQAWLTQKGF